MIQTNNSDSDHVSIDLNSTDTNSSSSDSSWVLSDGEFNDTDQNSFEFVSRPDFSQSETVITLSCPKKGVTKSFVQDQAQPAAQKVSDPINGGLLSTQQKNVQENYAALIKLRTIFLSQKNSIKKKKSFNFLEKNTSCAASSGDSIADSDIFTDAFSTFSTQEIKSSVISSSPSAVFDQEKKTGSTWNSLCVQSPSNVIFYPNFENKPFATDKVDPLVKKIDLETAHVDQELNTTAQGDRTTTEIAFELHNSFKCDETDMRAAKQFREDIADLLNADIASPQIKTLPSSLGSFETELPKIDNSVDKDDPTEEEMVEVSLFLKLKFSFRLISFQILLFNPSSRRTTANFTYLAPASRKKTKHPL